MNQPPSPADLGSAWSTARSGTPPPPAAPRPQPPLREVLKGLDVRELEGETVFDQLFGLPPQPSR